MPIKEGGVALKNGLKHCDILRNVAYRRSDIFLFGRRIFRGVTGSSENEVCDIVGGLFSFLVENGFATQCIACRGEDCDSNNQLSECDLNLSELPFCFEPFLRPKRHRCGIWLYVSTDGTSKKLRQCVLIQENKDICGEIAKEVAVEECILSASELSSYKLLAGDETVLDDSTISSSWSTDSSTDTSESSTTETPTTPAGSVVHTVSLVCLIMALLSLMF
ncbi:hypothetical protein NQ317_004919 [Molorchus minor]|uniref:Uncharacterized protein n=1 Tax=Molorchus minor TaxID=1323400 RepID=A0ABQ9JWS1_9CUCU|nr:hypothetical protein NQ317_004919 [Molorchus minor]